MVVFSKIEWGVRKFNHIARVFLYFSTLRGLRELLHLKGLPVNSFLTTSVIASYIQYMMPLWNSHWPIFILLKRIRLLFPQWSSVVGGTLWSWLILFTFISYSIFRPKTLKKGLHPGFEKLSMWFCYGNSNKQFTLNKYHEGTSDKYDLSCNKEDYHPKQSCMEHTYDTLYNCVKASLSLYPFAFTVSGMMNLGLKSYEKKFELFKFVTQQCFRSFGYSSMMMMGNRSVPCLIKWLTGSKNKNHQHDEINKCEQKEHNDCCCLSENDNDSYRKLKQNIIFVLYTICSITGMFYCQHPSQRKVMFDYMLAYSLLTLYNGYVSENDVALTGITTGLTFGCLHLEHNLKTIAHPSLLSNLTEFLFTSLKKNVAVKAIEALPYSTI
jgi:hypothetical protein